MHRNFGQLIGVLALIVGFVLLWSGAYPPVATPLVLSVEFPRGVAGHGEPLVTTGSEGNADFLAVRYLDEENAVLFYDAWGMGGPTSAPFALKPGERRRLTVEMPTLAHVAFYHSHEQRPLRVTLDGVVLLEAPVYFHLRPPAEIFFATNPVKGDLVRGIFRGRLLGPDGRAIAGGPEKHFGFWSRFWWLLITRPIALLLTLVAAFVIGTAAAQVPAAAVRIFRWVAGPHNPTPFPPLPEQPSHYWFLAAAGACLLVFSAVLTGGTFRFLAPDAFGEQYDWQARSLLQGRLDLPREARTDESFVFQGRTYIYFGPTPALLRLPFALFNVGFGRLTRVFMLAYFTAWLVAAYAILIAVARLARGSTAWPSRHATVLIIASAGLGSTLLFLASRAYAYHEAILCGAVFALWGAWCVLRWLDAPARGWWLGALVCGILAVHARPPTGLFALGMLGFAALAIALRELDQRPADVTRWQILRLPLAIATLAVAGVLSFNALSYLKFESFAGAPLRYHLQYDSGRLAAIGGKNFHLENFRHNFDAYAWRLDVVFRPTFPYLYVTPRDEHDYPDARIDLAEPTLALPWAMPVLSLLGLAGAAWALGRWNKSRLPLAVLFVGSAPMALALLTAVAISHRYTGDFCPTLVCAAAFGTVALDLLPTSARRIAWTALTLLTVAGTLVTLALALHYQGEGVWGVPDEFKARYQMLRHAVDSALGFSKS